MNRRPVRMAKGWFQAMRRIELQIVRILMALACAVTASAAMAENVVVKRFKTGESADSVGMIAGADDAESVGPQALYAGEGNQLYLLDQVNGRILQFDAKRPAEARSLELPEQLKPSDMVVNKGHLFVWDGAVHSLRVTGPDNAPTRGLDELSTRGLDDPYVTSAFAQMGSEPPPSATGILDRSTRSIAPAQTRQVVRHNIASRGRGLLTVDVIPGAKLSTAEIEVRAAGQSEVLARLHVQVRDRLGAVEFLEVDNQGRMFVLTENVPDSSDRMPSAFVARYSAAGKLDRIYDIPLAESEALSRRYVTVSGEGDVYFLRTRKSEVDVIGVGARMADASGIIDNPAAAIINRANERQKRLSAAVRPLTRQQVIETAFSFAQFKWRLSPASYGPEPARHCSGLNRVRRPWYLAGKAGQEVTGVPYCWGCHGTLEAISRKLSQGMLAGNVCTHEDPHPNMVGVDCSAFVSAAWGLASHFTTDAIPTITDVVKDPWSLRPGDALNKPGVHVMLFLRFTRDRKVEVMEASTRGCNGRVCRNVYPLTSMLARGYTPVRYRALANYTLASVSEPTAEPKPEQREHHGR
jgi:hypothetical protein